MADYNNMIVIMSSTIEECDDLLARHDLPEGSVVASEMMEDGVTVKYWLSVPREIAVEVMKEVNLDMDAMWDLLTGGQQ